ncbi:MAG: Gfo/Idh/MocA family oxidoreductase [Candidatus Gastranaerophilales bacterium]|nr:Gfo/Idh/MocA family oxidoreductase [Candidatus Gastranaerophilales bacterium]
MANENKYVGVAGCGIWGKNIVRNFYSLNALNTVCDLDDDTLAKIRNDYPGTNTTKDFNYLINNPQIRAICVITPSHTHFGLVKLALEHGKHVYVEKPISIKADEALKLKETAEEKGLILMVGHLLLYHPAVNRLKMLIEEGVLGNIKYVQSDRLNINYFKNDRSVMWDLAPHDVSMVSYVINSEPKNVISATGTSTEGNKIFDITHITIEYKNGVIAQISDSWIHPQKRVSLLVRGDKGSAVLDDTLPDHKLLLYDNTKPGQQNIEIPDYLEIEPLKLECQHFLHCIETGKTPRSGGENGYITVKALEDAEKIMFGTQRGELDNVDYALSRSKKV